MKKGCLGDIIDRAHGGLSSKIRVVADAEGVPSCTALTPGQTSDKESPLPLIESLAGTSQLLADCGDHAPALVYIAEVQGAKAHCPNQCDRKLQFRFKHDIYRPRNLVERFFSKFRGFSSLAKRFDELT